MVKYSKAVTKKCTKIIFEQMDNYIYKINSKNGNSIFGFFCYIKCKNKQIPVLITDNQIINDISDNLIDISIDKKIEIDNIIFNDKKNNIAIIEIKENMTKYLNFLDLDERLYDKSFELYLDEDSIYIIHYNVDNKNNKNISVSYSAIYNINNSKIRYSGNINTKIKICPIFNLSNNKIIGIHQCSSKYINKGIIMNNIVHKFINYYKCNKNKIKLFNEIQLFIDIDNYIPYEKIFFLNSKELNEKNTKIFINNEKYEYNQYFIPTKKGEYNIIL